MKTTLTAVSALLCLMTGSAFAASQGTISFTGNITDSTCDVSVNNTGGDATVTLPTVSAAELASKGKTTGRTNFTLGLNNCVASSTGGASTVSAFFQPGSTIDAATGHLIQQTAGGAQKVSLQLLDGGTGANYAPIVAGDASQLANTKYASIPAAGSTLELPYAVEYYADGQVTAGAVTSSVVYNLQYK